jgi:hypothetical protein
MVAERTPEPEDDPAELEFERETEAVIEDDDETVTDDTRHYEQDPDQLVENARDADEQEQDDLLDVDQGELDELGLTLDDPHQPEAE